MDEVDRVIINGLQEGFPICERPYAATAQQLGLTEAELIDRLGHLLEDGVLSRFGPLIHAEQVGGGLTLAAMQVPAEDLERVIEQVNAFPEVAHNYERDHVLNMWFVLATERPEQVGTVIAAIESRTGYPVYNFPKEEEYFLNLRLAV
ncbi:MAG: Lrp/AsnC family transcriptional regulator [Gammaproteobacteria bacterium]|nr:Lrp/AsnC family transcriptional regulator [Gammaproteobacteria bacterium]MCW9059326.1 Lrp/AsnC family transcriptional regulator [Gammaproteobacteria bacterium]